MDTSIDDRTGDGERTATVLVVDGMLWDAFASGEGLTILEEAQRAALATGKEVVLYAADRDLTAMPEPGSAVDPAELHWVEVGRHPAPVAI